MANPYRERVEKLAAEILALETDQSIEAERNEETYHAMRIAESKLGRGLAKLSTRQGSTENNLIIKRVKGGLF